jgi:hypothetical protein
MANWFTSKFKPPEPTGPSLTIRSFSPGADQTVSRDCVTAEQGAWAVDVAEQQTVRLFEVANPAAEQCMLAYRARLKTEGLSGRAYLEMWCRLPGRGEFFSKGLHQTVKGTTDWGSYEIPFYLKKGQRPDLIKLNLAVEGAGKLWIRDVELLMTPLA